MTRRRISAEEYRLRQVLTALVLKLRQGDSLPRPSIPRFISHDLIRQSNGDIVRRKTVILTSGGCSIPTCSMCSFTNENNYGRPVAGTDLLGQVLASVGPYDSEFSVLALYNDGSFFASREIPQSVRLAIAKIVSGSGVRRLMVESLPQFIRPSILGPFVEALQPVELEVGIGLQSADDVVRETLVNTRITRDSFERAIATLWKFGASPKIYLMVKPPFVSEGAAITDILGSVDYVRALGIGGVTLCPTRVSRNTVAWLLWQAGLYDPPNLWTIVQIVRLIHETISVRIACVNLRGGDFESVSPVSCSLCNGRVVEGLCEYSETGDLARLPNDCVCRVNVEATALNADVMVSEALRKLSLCGIK